MPLSQLRQDPVASECEKHSTQDQVSCGAAWSAWWHKWFVRTLPFITSLQRRECEQPAEPRDISLLAVNYVKALGGFGNLQSMSATRTHLQIELENSALVNFSSLSKLGVMDNELGNNHTLSLFIGPLALLLNEKIQGLASRQGLDLQPRAAQLAPFTLG